MLARPKWSRKRRVVPYWSARPTTSARPVTLISRFSCSSRSTGPTRTPRTASTSARVAGWR